MDGMAMMLAVAWWPGHAMPLMIGVLCVMAISYRYYSAFLAAKVAALDDMRQTPAYRLEDGKNYEPTNKWVLFGHHFAAISGAGPLIGPVLAAQFGYLPGLLWIVIGVCLGGAVQDFLVLGASLRRNGKSLAEIARDDIGKFAGGAAAVAILFILVIALAGLGKVVVNALGGDRVKYPANSTLALPAGMTTLSRNVHGNYIIPAGSTLKWGRDSSMQFSEQFEVSSPSDLHFQDGAAIWPAGAYRLVPGSAWGTFTIACTIPIALFIGLYLYRLRPGRVIEASVIGGLMTVGATFLGGWVAEQSFGQIFNLSASTVTWTMAAYGFVAAVLPVWVLLCPRDYLSSFLKIGTIAILVGGTILANPKLEAPVINHVFLTGGPAVAGNIFPFLFITIMCGAISGFHALVSSGTTPKMIRRESDARMIGYGAMLMEGLVGVVALMSAATLPSADYYAMNTDLEKVPAFHQRILEVGGAGGVDHITQWEQNTRESLRGRTGGAVTLAVGMAHIFDQAADRLGTAGQSSLRAMWKYWYHFAIMFEALFILTTIDAGTRIGRFMLQEVAGRMIHPKLGQAGWWPSAWISTALIVLGWVYFIRSSSMATIWPMFGIANQMLAVIALAIVSAYLANEGRVKYVWVTALPMAVVILTTTTAGIEMLVTQFNTISAQLHGDSHALLIDAIVRAALIVAMLACGFIIVATAARKVLAAMRAEQVENDSLALPAAP